MGEVVEAGDDFRCCFRGNTMEGKGTGGMLLRPVMTSAAVPKEQQRGC